MYLIPIPQIKVIVILKKKKKKPILITIGEEVII